MRSEDSLAQEILKEKKERFVYPRLDSTLSLAKEASWGGDRKIEETIIASPELDIRFSIDDS
ncbi:hypothetical protein ES708_34134 [subsurface metagenome]